MIFLKPPSSIVGPGDPIVLPKYSQRVEHEGELAIVIGKTCSHLGDNDNPLSYVFGYTCANDVTARDLQKADVQFTRAKGFDTFCPDRPAYRNRTRSRQRHCRNARKRRSPPIWHHVADDLFLRFPRSLDLANDDAASRRRHIHRHPLGVGPLVAKDTVEVSVTGIGVLRNPVHAAQA